MQSLAHSGTPLAAHGRFLLSSLPGALTIAAALALLPAAAAQVPAVSLEPANAPVDDLQAPPAEVRRYMSHVNFLADPFLQGRLPGTQGMEIAKDYVQYWFEAAGLKPGVPGKDGAEDSWRQPFELAGTFQLQEVALEGPGGKVLEREKDYSVPGWGGFGDVTGELCFVGYAIEEGTEDVPYQGFPAECDLTGKVVLMLRFEPMNDEGRSAFTGRSWSARAGLGPKLSAVAQRGAAAVLVVSPPGARDSRAKNLVDVSSWTNNQTKLPVMQVHADVVAQWLGEEHKLEELTAAANAAGVVRDLGKQVHVRCTGDYRGVIAENLIGLLPGKGALAGEYVVIGGHLDHLGYGGFGSRDRENSGKLVHPGADDNASGCSALILLAESLGQAYAALPEGESARSILFMPFSAEESGLNGAQHYTRNPTVPLDKIALMINFDMIGRLEKHRLNISGLGSGLGMAELIEPLKANNPLELVLEENTQAASDHWAFVQARVPAAFVSMDGIHDDYHTPRDTADLIRPVDAVHATHFVHDLAFAAARVEAPLAFQEPKPRTRQARNRVRFGVQMGEAPEGQQGVTITEVVEDGTAATAGVLAGDLLVKWDGKEVTSRMEWVTLLSGAKPGDEVSFVVMRGGKPVELKATLEGR